jgi:hypothetical protein
MQRKLPALAIGALGAIMAMAGLGASSTAKAQPTTSAIPAAILPSLVLDMNRVGSTDGTSVVPSTGPLLTVRRRGSGAIVRRGAGRSFLRGGQQSSDTAFVEGVGEAAVSQFSTEGGSLAVTAVSLADLANRTSVSGRNHVALVQLTTGAADGPAGHAVALSFSFDDGPSLSATVNGSSGYANLPETAFRSGQRYRLTLRWSSGNAVISIGGAEVGRFSYPIEQPTWPAPRLTIGASADYGAGYFSAHQDALERVEIRRIGVPPTTTTTTTTTQPPSTTTTTAPPSTTTTTTTAPPPTTSTTTTTAPPSTTTTTIVPPGNYPTPWEWTPGWVDNQPLPATVSDGQPLIRQIRNGTVIATYTKLGGAPCSGRPNSLDNPMVECGAFSRGNTYANKRDGDIFEVYPAVYEGDDQQPWIGAMYENDAAYSAGQFIRANDITIRGVTVNGKRPVLRLPATGASNNTLGQSIVYVDAGNRITLENLDIDGGTAGSVGRSGVFVSAASNVTLRDVAVHGFRRARGNGVFSTGNTSGTLLFERVQLFDNGGDGGPEHNAYINASVVDPNFTVRMINSYSTGVYYGHLFKSRAQNTVLEGNYFRGTKPLPGESIAEAFLVEIPNGGRLTMRNNILAKDASGDGSNGGFVFYAAEGVPDSRPLSVLIEHNTFVSFVRYYDTQNHPLWPMGFFYPQQVPGAPGFPVSNTTVRNNVFVGFENQTWPGNAFMNYRGDSALTVGFDGIRQDYTLVNPISAAGSTVLGTPAYLHKSRPATRARQTVGARD